MNPYEEHDSHEQLKAWWNTYGNAVIGGVLLGAAALYGWRYWQGQMESERVTAAVMYEQLVEADHGSNAVEARAIGDRLVAEFERTPYSGLAALMLARIEADSGNMNGAMSRLAWASQHATDSATINAARLRLARLHLDAGKPEAALALTKGEGREGYEAHYAEIEGDVAASRGDVDAARAAWDRAIAANKRDADYNAILTMKRDALVNKSP